MQQDYKIENLTSQTSDTVTYRARSKNGRPHTLTRLNLSEKILTPLRDGQFRLAYARLLDLNHGCLRAVVDGGLDPNDQIPWVATTWWEGKLLSEQIKSKSVRGADIARIRFHGETLIHDMGDVAGALSFDPHTIVTTRSLEGERVSTFEFNYAQWFSDWTNGISPGAREDAYANLNKLISKLEDEIENMERPKTAIEESTTPDKAALKRQTVEIRPTFTTTPSVNSARNSNPAQPTSKSVRSQTSVTPTTAADTHPKRPQLEREDPNKKSQKKMFFLVGMIIVVCSLTIVLAMKKPSKKEEISLEETGDQNGIDGSKMRAKANEQSQPMKPTSRSVVSETKGWTDLLAGGLENWDIWLGRPHHTVALPNSPPVDEGKMRSALGKEDPNSVFKIINVEGKQTLRISGEINGGMMTKKSYQNYHFSARFRWGQKKWPCSLSPEKDSGVLIHCFGKPGDRYEFWRHGVEYQIRDWTAGDLWMLGTVATVPVNTKIEPNGREVDNFKWGQPLKKVTNFSWRSPEAKFKKSDWNLIEIIAREGEAIFLLNGTMSVALQAMKKNHKGEASPLTKGDIYLQSAGSEIFFQDVKIRSIESDSGSLEEIVASLRE